MADSMRVPPAWMAGAQPAAPPAAASNAAGSAPAPAPAGGSDDVVDLTADPVADEERAGSDGEAAESAVAAEATGAGAGSGVPGGGAGTGGPGPLVHAPPATASPVKSSTGKRPREASDSDDDDAHDQVRGPSAGSCALGCTLLDTDTRTFSLARAVSPEWERRRTRGSGSCGISSA